MQQAFKLRDIGARNREGVSKVKAGLEIEPMGESTGKCACCGGRARSIWGIVHRVEAETVASYFVTWVDGVALADHPANIDLIIGAWGEGTGGEDRVAVSLKCTVNESVPAMIVIDAADRKIANNPLVGVALNREEVMGTPVAKHAFDISDAVVWQDQRFKS